MNRIKKFTTIIMLAAMLIQLTGCGDNSNNNEEIDESVTENKDEPKESSKEKLVLAYASDSELIYIKEAVKEYNAASLKSEITIKKYIYGEETGVSYDEALKQLEEDVLSGDEIDMVVLSNIRPERISGKNMFENLYTYIEKDTVISQKQLNKKVLKLFEDDGSLIVLPQKFTVAGMTSGKNVLGDEKLTLDMFLKIVEENKDKEIYDYNTRENVLQSLYLCNINYFVDYRAKSCSFNDGNFEKILQIALEFKEDNGYYNGFEEDNKLIDGTMLFSDMGIGYPDEYLYPCVYFDNSFNVTGYPSVDGNTLEIVANGLYAINANSKHKEACWKFIQTEFLKYSKMDPEASSSFSVDIDEMEKQLYSICITDADGKKKERDIYQYLHFEDKILELPYVNEDKINELREVLLSVNSLRVAGDIETEIYKVVAEEADAFFNGTKSSTEACESIQTRAESILKDL